MRLLALILSSLLICLPAQATTSLYQHHGKPRVFTKFPIAWGFECNFPEKFKAEVRASFQYWDDLTPRDLFKEDDRCHALSPRTHIVVGTVDKDYSGKLKKDDDGEIVEGTAYIYPEDGDGSLGGVIALWRGWLREEYRDTRLSIVRHEIGHVLGFEHNIKIEQCLMHPYINTPSHTYHGHEKNLCNSELKVFRQHYQ